MLFIYQPLALPTLIHIEGEQWGRDQEANKDSPTGFHANLVAYHRREKYSIDYPEEEITDSPLSDFHDVDGITGASGIARYKVLPNGEIVLIASSVSTQIEHIAKARSAGISIEGDQIAAVTDE